MMRTMLGGSAAGRAVSRHPANRTIAAGNKTRAKLFMWPSRSSILKRLITVDFHHKLLVPDDPMIFIQAFSVISGRPISS